MVLGGNFGMFRFVVQDLGFRVQGLVVGVILTFWMVDGSAGPKRSGPKAVWDKSCLGQKRSLSTKTRLMPV